MLNLEGKGYPIAIIENGKNRGKKVYLNEEQKEKKEEPSEDSYSYNSENYEDSDYSGDFDSYYSGESEYSEDSEDSEDYEELKYKKEAKMYKKELEKYKKKAEKNKLKQIKDIKGIKFFDGGLVMNDGTFVQYPDTRKDRQRQVLYIAGPSGSGKSTYVSKFLKYYSEINPKKKIIIFSRVSKDPAFDKKFKNLRRFAIDETLLDPETAVDIERDLCNSMVIFDDINTINNKALRNAVLQIQTDILETGRHPNIDIISTNHLLMDYNKTRTLLNEAHFVTFFIGTGSYHNKRFLKEYAGCDKKMIDRILKAKSRWITIKKTFPMYVLTENEIFMLN
jgi:hypothetical protein